MAFEHGLPPQPLVVQIALGHKPTREEDIKRTPTCLGGPLTRLLVIPCETPVGSFFPDAPGLDESKPVEYHRRLSRADRRSALGGCGDRWGI